MTHDQVTALVSTGESETFEFKAACCSVSQRTAGSWVSG